MPQKYNYFIISVSKTNFFLPTGIRHSKQNAEQTARLFAKVTYFTDLSKVSLAYSLPRGLPLTENTALIFSSPS